MLENYFGQRPTQAEQQRLLAVQAALELVQATSVVSGDPDNTTAHITALDLAAVSRDIAGLADAIQAALVVR
ncbi:hypothetical protein A9B99_00325 [Mangrovibacter phragmitis]|uniref:Uncharacterized protein n=1 Tax=Mangrovibacter phragmitis TaxID=1691903 RepID=A0A1B7L7B4_9ENTR|nr:hypothetical protein [Mangrovibacter phragmitis]OAT78223.1 hypothetical protein A9B99_00325 [Mangrovibacter phragmitis]